MLHRRFALAAILALSVVTAACGGTAEEATGGEAAATAVPTSTPRPEPTPTEEPAGAEVSETPAPTQSATESPQVEPTPTQPATATPQVEPTPVEKAVEEAVPDGPIDIAAHLSEKTMRLWDVYNTHDPDALEVFYSADYWQEEVDEIRSNMQPFKNLGLTFTAEETSPPAEIAPGKWELKHTARFQGGLVNMVFIYEEFGGEWRLTYAKPE